MSKGLWITAAVVVSTGFATGWAGTAMLHGRPMAIVQVRHGQPEAMAPGPHPLRATPGAPDDRPGAAAAERGGRPAMATAAGHFPRKPSTPAVAEGQVPAAQASEGGLRQRRTIQGPLVSRIDRNGSAPSGLPARGRPAPHPASQRARQLLSSTTESSELADEEIAGFDLKGLPPSGAAETPEALAGAAKDLRDGGEPLAREPHETPNAPGAAPEPIGIPETGDGPGARNLRNSHDVRNPADRVGQTVVVIKRTEHRLYLYRDGELVRTYRVGVGKHRGSTPRGQFRIIGKAHNPAWSYKGKYVPGGSPANPLGHWWMALSAKARSGSRIGIHGTNAPWSIGKNVSRGCIRMYNRDAARLFRQVSAGTPVVID